MTNFFYHAVLSKKNLLKIYKGSTLVSKNIKNVNLTLFEINKLLFQYKGNTPLEYLKSFNKTESIQNKEKNKEKFFWKKVWEWVVKRILSEHLNPLRNELLKDLNINLIKTNIQDFHWNNNLLIPNPVTEKRDNGDLDLFMFTEENPILLIEKLKATNKLCDIKNEKNSKFYSFLYNSEIVWWLVQIDLHFINNKIQFENSYFDYYRIPYLFFLLWIALHKINLKISQDGVFIKKRIWKYWDKYIKFENNILNFLENILFVSKTNIKNICSYKELAEFINWTIFSEINFLNTLKSEYNQKFKNNDKLNEIKKYLILWDMTSSEFENKITSLINENYPFIEDIVNWMEQEEIEFEEKREQRKNDLKKLFKTNDLNSVNISEKKYFSVYTGYSKDLFLIKELQEILEEKISNDVSLYLVWGSVRDVILWNSISDYDLTWNLSSEDIIKYFWWNKTEKNWTVFFKYRGFDFEYTPLFNNSIELDSKKRDFSINSIYLRLKDLHFIDLYWWIDSIKNKILKATENPNDRYTEDYLRIIRAIRFKNKYKFNIDEETELFIHKLKNNLISIKNERVKDEFIKWIKIGSFMEELIEKDILQLYFPEINEIKWQNQFSPHTHKYDVLEHSLLTYKNSLKYFPEKNYMFYFSALFHDIWKTNISNFKNWKFINVWLDIIHKNFKNLCFQNKDIDYIYFLIKHIKEPFLNLDIDDNNERTLITKLKKFLISTKLNLSFLKDLVELNFCNKLRYWTIEEVDCLKTLTKFYKAIEKIREKENFLTLSSLNINWNDLIALWYKGKELKIILEETLLFVNDFPEKNEKNQLIEHISKKYKDKKIV